MVTSALGRTCRAQKVEETLAKRQRKTGDIYECIDCSSILRSVSELERFWNIAKYVLTLNRSKMAAQLFKAFVVMNGKDL